LISREGMSIDLTDMIRQEIILHYSMIPVCSQRCKGLCQGCKINLNHDLAHLPDCPGESQHIEGHHQPFAQLKDLFKSNNK